MAFPATQGYEQLLIVHPLSGTDDGGHDARSCLSLGAVGTL